MQINLSPTRCIMHSHNINVMRAHLFIIFIFSISPGKLPYDFLLEQRTRLSFENDVATSKVGRRGGDGVETSKSLRKFTFFSCSTFWVRSSRKNVSRNAKIANFFSLRCLLFAPLSQDCCRRCNAWNMLMGNVNYTCSLRRGSWWGARRSEELLFSLFMSLYLLFLYTQALSPSSTRSPIH